MSVKKTSCVYYNDATGDCCCIPVESKWEDGRKCTLNCHDYKKRITCAIDGTPTNTPTNSQTEPEHDAVSHPSHYTSGGIECIDCIKAALGENFMGFLIGNVIKYTYRYKHKNGVQDLEKARWYLDRAIKELTENAEK